MLLDYISAAMKTAVYEKMEDGTFCGTIRRCPGVIAFAATLYECQEELRSGLEGWLIVKLRHGDTLPVLGRVNLNRGRKPRPKTAARAQLVSLQASRLHPQTAPTRFLSAGARRPALLHAIPALDLDAALKPGVLGAATADAAA